MPWSQALALFFGGVFLANSAPHFIAGVSGQRFHSPFAKPPFRGLSSPAVNVLWALFNLAVAWTLLIAVARFELREGTHTALAGAGFGLMALNITRSLARMRALSGPDT